MRVERVSWMLLVGLLGMLTTHAVEAVEIRVRSKYLAAGVACRGDVVLLPTGPGAMTQVLQDVNLAAPVTVELAAGTYQVIVRCELTNPDRFAKKPRFLYAKTERTCAGDAETTWEIPLQPSSPADIKVSLVDVAGAPVRGAEVKLAGEATPQVTDGDGRATLMARFGVGPEIEYRVDTTGDWSILPLPDAMMYQSQSLRITVAEQPTMATLMLRPSTLPEGSKAQRFKLFLRHEGVQSYQELESGSGEVRMTLLADGDTYVEKVWVFLADSNEIVECVPETPVVFTVKDGVVQGETQRQATLVAGELGRYTTRLTIEPPLTEGEQVRLSSMTHRSIEVTAVAEHLDVTLPLGEVVAVRGGSKDLAWSGSRQRFVYRGDTTTAITFTPLTRVTVESIGDTWGEWRNKVQFNYSDGDGGDGGAGLLLPLEKPWEVWVPGDGTLWLIDTRMTCFFELGTVADQTVNGRIVLDAADVVGMTLYFSPLKDSIKDHPWWIYAAGQTRPVYFHIEDAVPDTLDSWFPPGDYSIVRQDESGRVVVAEFTVKVGKVRHWLVPLGRFRKL